MEALITQLGAVAEYVITTAGTVATSVVEHPICLIGTGVMLCGAVVGMLKRLITVA